MVNLQELIKEGAKELRLFVHKCELDKNNYTNEILWAGAMEEYNNTWVTFKANTVTNDWLFGGDLGSGAWTFTSEWLFESDCREEDNTLVAEHVDITESDWSEDYKQLLEEVITLEEDDSPPVIIAPEQMLESIKPTTKEKSTTVNDWTNKHYDFEYTLTEDDIETGSVRVDAYFVNRMWDINNWDDTGAAFHILKTLTRVNNSKNNIKRELTAIVNQAKILAKLHGVYL